MHEDVCHCMSPKVVCRLGTCFLSSPRRYTPGFQVISFFVQKNVNFVLVLFISFPNPSKNSYSLKTEQNCMRFTLFDVQSFPNHRETFPPHGMSFQGRVSCSRLVFHLQYLSLAGSFPLENAARRSSGKECMKSIYCTVSHCFCRKFCTPDVGVLSILGIFRFLERSYMVMW